MIGHSIQEELKAKAKEAEANQGVQTLTSASKVAKTWGLHDQNQKFAPPAQRQKLRQCVEVNP